MTSGAMYSDHGNNRIVGQKTKKNNVIKRERVSIKRKTLEWRRREGDGIEKEDARSPSVPTNEFALKSAVQVRVSITGICEQ
jgi:hypothetical protein